MNVALHHFTNGVNDKDALRGQLILECQRLGTFEGQAATDHCIHIVNDNINKIYDDLHAGVNPLTTCIDIRECEDWWDSTWSSTWSTPHPDIVALKQQQQKVYYLKSQLIQIQTRPCHLTQT